jgi:hypothetical protein
MFFCKKTALGTFWKPCFDESCHGKQPQLVALHKRASPQVNRFALQREFPNLMHQTCNLLESGTIASVQRSKVESCSWSKYCGSILHEVGQQESHSCIDDVVSVHVNVACDIKVSD